MSDRSTFFLTFKNLSVTLFTALRTFPLQSDLCARYLYLEDPTSAILRV